MDNNDLKEIFSDSQSGEAAKRKISLKIVALVTVIVLILTVGAFFVGRVVESNRGLTSDMPLMLEAYELIKKYYYEDISWETFQEIAAAAFAGSLDPFSGILSKDYDAVSAGAVGLHISSTLFNEHVVTFAVPNMPAYSARAIQKYDDDMAVDDSFDAASQQVSIREGDKVFAVGVEVTTESGDKQYSTMRVENASLSYLSKVMSAYADYNELIYIIKKYDGNGGYTDGYYVFKIRRSTFEETEKFAYYYPFAGDVGIIKLTKFDRDADPDFAQCISDFVLDGKKKLILDLRDNGGGELSSLQYVAHYLLNNPRNEALPIMNLIYNSGYGKMKSEIEYSSTTNPLAGILPAAQPLSKKIDGFDIVVLTNGNSASASEGLIGALQCYNNTQIVGSTTYGKGVAQATFELSTGDILYVTNGRYFVPTKDAGGNIVWERTIHGIGFTPAEENTVEERITEYSIDKCVARAMEIFGY